MTETNTKKEQKTRSPAATGQIGRVYSEQQPEGSSKMHSVWVEDTFWMKICRKKHF
jgi:hypothetical protein